MHNEHPLEYPTKLTFLGIPETQEIHNYAINKLEKQLVQLARPNTHLKLTFSVQPHGLRGRQKDGGVIDVKDEEERIQQKNRRENKQKCFRVQALFHINKRMFVCKASGEELYSVIDMLEEKMKKIIGNWHERTVKHHSEANIATKEQMQSFNPDDEKEDPVREINRSIFEENVKSVDEKVSEYIPQVAGHYFVEDNPTLLSVNEALNYMETSSHHTFFTFKNADSDDQEIVSLLRKPNGNGGSDEFILIHHAH